MQAHDEEELLVTLKPRELEFLKDALWFASRAEQAVLADDEAWAHGFRAELREDVKERAAKGKPSFQDFYLPLTGQSRRDLLGNSEPEMLAAKATGGPPYRRLLADLMPSMLKLLSLSAAYWALQRRFGKRKT